MCLDVWPQHWYLSTWKSVSGQLLNILVLRCCCLIVALMEPAIWAVLRGRGCWNLGAFAKCTWTGVYTHKRENTNTLLDVLSAEHQVKQGFVETRSFAIAGLLTSKLKCIILRCFDTYLFV